MAWDSNKKLTPYFVSTVATGIYRDEFDSDTGYQSISQISGWLENNVGLLNTQIYTSFSGSGTLLVIDTTSCGEVPQVTIGLISFPCIVIS